MIPTVVRQILGRVAAACQTVEVAGSGAPNSTRWIFDVDHPGAQDMDIALQLIEPREGAPLGPAALAVALTPQSSGYYEAKPFFHMDASGALHLSATACRFPQRVLLRVVIDAIVPRVRS